VRAMRIFQDEESQDQSNLWIMMELEAAVEHVLNVILTSI
jgi:hypothetical protein